MAVVSSPAIRTDSSMRVLSSSSSCGVSSWSEAVLRQARRISVRRSFRLTRRRDSPLPFGAGRHHLPLSAERLGRSCSSASDTEGFSGKPAVGSSNVGAVGGRACSEAIGSSESGAMMPFLISVRPLRSGIAFHQVFYWSRWVRCGAELTCSLRPASRTCWRRVRFLPSTPDDCLLR